MKADFPRYTKTAKLGELGVRIVAKVVSDSFGWLFKRNHQEHDFGIDGQIELVSHDGFVTGQSLSVQIKCGESFLNEKTQWGYVYRGERKHFNYMVNHPLPVIIIVCNPETSQCFWTHFSPELTSSTGEGWKIEIPFANKLEISKDKIELLVPPTRDGYSELEHYWKMNKVIVESRIILYVLDNTDVKNQEIALPRAFFDRMRATREIAASCQGKVEISFFGYDDDPRELYEIPEVREYVSLLDGVLSDLFFFVRTEAPTFTIPLFVLCQTKLDFVKRSHVNPKITNVSFDPKPVADFITRHCVPLNELTEWLCMPLDKEKKIFFDVIARVGMGHKNDSKSSPKNKRKKK